MTQNPVGSEVRAFELDAAVADIDAAVETPVNLTKRQQELLREFEKSGNPKKMSPVSEGFLDKVKELWDDLRD